MKRQYDMGLRLRVKIKFQTETPPYSLLSLLIPAQEFNDKVRTITYICIKGEFTMLTAIKGYYDKGKIILKEEAPVKSKTEVIVTFLTEDNATIAGKRIPGGLKGKVSLPDDFNEPLDDLKDYR